VQRLRPAVSLYQVSFCLVIKLLYPALSAVAAAANTTTMTTLVMRLSSGTDRKFKLLAAILILVANVLLKDKA